jgi:uncharacterized membrane protein YccC
VRHQWRQFHRLSNKVMETLERWRETFPQVRDVELSKPLPNLDSFCEEIDLRFAELSRLLAGELPERSPKSVTLRIEKTEARALGHFQKAAVAVAKAQLDRLEELSRSLVDTVRDIRGYGREAQQPSTEEPSRSGLEIDPDRLGAARTAMVTLWIAFLIWVYIDPPGHAMFMFMTTLWVMVATLTRQSVTVLPPAFLIGILLGGVLYIFVMPHLSSYAQLGPMIFGVTFAIFYLCWAPRRRMMRTILLAVFNILISVDNQQTYNFAVYANTAAAILLSLAIAIATSYIPTSPRPEKVFLRLFRRFFQQAEFMLSRLALDRDQRRGWTDRWKKALYTSDLLALPQKLAVLGRGIDYAMLPDDTPEKVQDLVTNLQALAYRIKELTDAREIPQAALLIEQCQDELRAWRMIAQEQCRLWVEDPAKGIARGAEIEERLAARMARLETRIDETYRDVAEGELSERDFENFFRYLGGLRGLSEAGIGLIRVAETIDWPRWQEARF